MRASLVECLSESSHESILYDPFPDRVSALGGTSVAIACGWQAVMRAR
jgi:hypothetical protein